MQLNPKACTNAKQCGLKCFSDWNDHNASYKLSLRLSAEEIDEFRGGEQHLFKQDKVWTERDL